MLVYNIKINILAILILLCLLSCGNSSIDVKRNKENKRDTINSGVLKKPVKIQSKSVSFNILNFKFQLDSLLSIIEHKKFIFNWKCDTINAKTDDKILWYFGKNGLFNLLDPENFETLVLNHFYEPSSRKILRIYLIEGFAIDTTKSESAFQKIYKKKNGKLEIIADDGTEYYYINHGLTGLSDYVIQKGKMIYWINVSAQYSKTNFDKIITIFKSNLNQQTPKDSIKCYYNQGCE